MIRSRLGLLSGWSDMATEADEVAFPNAVEGLGGDGADDEFPSLDRSPDGHRVVG